MYSLKNRQNTRLTVSDNIYTNNNIGNNAENIRNYYIGNNDVSTDNNERIDETMTISTASIILTAKRISISMTTSAKHITI